MSVKDRYIYYVCKIFLMVTRKRALGLSKLLMKMKIADSMISKHFEEN